VHARTSPTVALCLATLPRGARALITAIESHDAMATAKLAARGIVPGVCLEVLQTGDPCLIGIDSDRWALSRSEAASIQVDVIPGPRRSLRQLFGRA